MSAARTAVWCEHANSAQWARAVAQRLEVELRRGLAATGRATLVACGGSTPGPIYAALARTSLDWRRIRVLPSDERWTSDGAHRNGALLAGSLGVAGARLISLHTRDADPFDAAAELCARAKAALPFDAALLGMGPDGHTLSWFAGARGLDAALSGAGAAQGAGDTGGSALVAAIHAGESPVAAPIPRRVTLTFAALMQARRIFVAITGSEKRRVAQRALESAADSTAGSARARAALPVCALLCQQRVPVEFHWAA